MRSILLGGRVGMAVVLGLAVLAPLFAHARSSCQTTPVRVLLHRSAEGLSLEVNGASYRFEEPSRLGLRVNGRSQASWWSPGGNHRVGELEVSGRLQVIPLAGQIAVIAHVPLDEYVEGALLGEIPALWAEEALRAQAVVSRTYALYEKAVHARDAYDVKATTADQVYKGRGAPESIRRAVRDTGCQILTFRDRPILAVFHSAAGGRTASAGEVWGRDLTYLVSREVPGEDDSPDTYWRASVSGTTLQRALTADGHSLGDVREVRVTARSASGRVRILQITGTRGRAELSGRRLRSVLGTGTLKSTLFEVRVEPDGGFSFVGSGRGHGVGMSQWGARAMAVRGVAYPHILSNFYPGTRLEEWETPELSVRGVSAPPR